MEYFRGSMGVTGFCHNTPLKICLVFHVEDGQNEIFFSFTNILSILA